MRKKRGQIRAHARKKKLHCILIFNISIDPDPNFYYLTGYDGYGCLILLKDREILLVPPMEYQRANKLVKGLSVKVYRKNLWKLIRSYAKAKAIGLDYGSITLSFMKVLRKELKKKFVDVSPILKQARYIKTEKEIRTLRKACSISDNILKKLFSNFKKFATEKQAADFLEIETMKSGCKLSFPPIVASGPGAAEPHHTPENKRIKKGFCIIDFGVKYKGYCSDTTRVAYIRKPSQKDIDLYEFILNAQTEVVKSIRTGQKCSDIHKLMNHKLGRYAKNFIHGLGHGVGVEIHELPDLKPKSKMNIENGMVFTVEPGIYFKNKLGIRIEDTVLMDNKPVVLTKISKKLRIID